MRNVLPPTLPLLALLASAALSSACALTPGYAPDPAPSTPGLIVTAVVDASDTSGGSRALLHVAAHGVGAVLGISAHVRVDPAFVVVDGAVPVAFFGDADGTAEITRVMAHVDGADVALGGSHVTAVESDVADGDVADIQLHAAAAGASRVDVIDAVARKADGSFVPLASAGGVITLNSEAAP